MITHRHQPLLGKAHFTAAVPYFDIDERTVTLYDCQHDVIHIEGWNSDWNMFFEMARESGIQPTREDIVEFGDYMVEKYELQDAEAHYYQNPTVDSYDHLM